MRPAPRLGRGDLLHLGHVAPRLRRRLPDRPARPSPVREPGVDEVVEDVLDDPVRMRGAERLREERDPPLVDRRGAHLHGGREPDRGADDDELDPRQRKARDLCGTRSREVDPRRARGMRRRARDRAVDGLEPVRRERRVDPLDGRGRGRVEVGHERPCVAGRDGDRLGHLERGAGRHDAEDDVRLVDERLQRPDVLDSRLGGEASCPFAATVERHDHARATVPEPRADRAPHRPASDEPDDQRAREDSNLRPAD